MTSWPRPGRQPRGRKGAPSPGAGRMSGSWNAPQARVIPLYIARTRTRPSEFPYGGGKKYRRSANQPFQRVDRPLDAAFAQEVDVGEHFLADLRDERVGDDVRGLARGDAVL